MRKRNPSSAVAVTAHGNFLYLLAEMEASLQRGTIRWTAESAQAAQRRVTNLLADLGAIGVRLRAN